MNAVQNECPPRLNSRHTGDEERAGPVRPEAMGTEVVQARQESHRRQSPHFCALESRWRGQTPSQARREHPHAGLMLGAAKPDET